ncbi:helix-turn-helix domain-containing protein [Enterococcus sp. 22-H-5-01]|uniref:helix-turn-helix domain-containing protein n=1 Tax=Enterococcus sp. 22-H-5-01 TaxID=3418555 RepID=UPI003D07611C
MEVNLHEVGNRIRNIRLNQGCNMTEFGKKLDNYDPNGKTKSGTVSNWETGKNLPNNDRLKQIAEIGNTTVDYILYGSLDDYAHILLKNLEVELKKNTSVSNAVIPFIINELNKDLFPLYFKQQFSDSKTLEIFFNEQKEQAIKRWSDPTQIETNILDILSKSLTDDIYNTIPYLYSDRYKDDYSKIKNADGVTPLSDLKRKYLSVLDNYQKSSVDILRYNNEEMINQAIDDLQKLINKSPTMFL